MKFTTGLLVWVSRGLGKTPQVFPRLRGPANRRVDLHLPLIVSMVICNGWLGRNHARCRSASETSVGVNGGGVVNRSREERSGGTNRPARGQGWRFGRKTVT